jgi:hypothetical protein
VNLTSAPLAPLRTRKAAVAAVAMAGLIVGVATQQASASAAPAPAAALIAPAAAVADTLVPPAPARELFSVRVLSGVQTYVCGSSGVWSTASIPSAVLGNARPVIHHATGPSWSWLADGSAVTATKEASVAVTGSIPELLLKVAAHSGPAGVMSRVTYIQRLATSGGVAPTTACTPGTDAAPVSIAVPYGATYAFWG